MTGKWAENSLHAGQKDRGQLLEEALTALEELGNDFPAIVYLTKPLHTLAAKLLAGEPITCCTCGATGGVAIDRAARWASGETSLNAWERCRTCGGPQCNYCAVAGASCGHNEEGKEL